MEEELGGLTYLENTEKNSLLSSVLSVHSSDRVLVAGKACKQFLPSSHASVATFKVSSRWGPLVIISFDVGFRDVPAAGISVYHRESFGSFLHLSIKDFKCHSQHLFLLGLRVII